MACSKLLFLKLYKILQKDEIIISSQNKPIDHAVVSKKTHFLKFPLNKEELYNLISMRAIATKIYFKNGDKKLCPFIKYKTTSK